MDDLLRLVLARPREVLATARAILAAKPEPYAASVAHQAVGIVMRDADDIDAAIRELRLALRLAKRLQSADRQGSVLGSLGVALVYAGRTLAGLAALESAIQMSTGMALGRALHLRGHVHWELGRHAEALDDFRKAVSTLQRAGERIWTAHALNGRGLAYMAMGSLDRADADFVAAGRLYTETDQELAAARTMHNRAALALRRGDVPSSLSLFDTAAADYERLKEPTHSLSHDRCAALLAAGLASEALTEADAAVRNIEQARGWSTKRAELLLDAAISALAAAQPQVARDRAQIAHRLFRSQHSTWGQARTALVLAEAQYAAGPASARLLNAAKQAAQKLEEVGSTNAVAAHLLAGRVALKLGRQAEADRYLTAAALNRLRGPSMVRATGWLGEALRAEADSQPRRLQAACRRGLEVLDEHHWMLGASELRAYATAQGAELAAVAQRHAAHARRPRLLFAASERWRATALAVPAVRPPTASAFSADLAALRHVTRTLEEAKREGAPTAALQREQLRLEKAVRAASLTARGTPAAGGSELGVSRLLAELDDAQLVELVDVDGVMHVLVCGGGRVRQFTAGRSCDAMKAVDFARFALRRLARARPGDDPDSAAAILKAAGPDLQDAILGQAGAQLRDGPVIVVPPGKFHAIPWALLPSLRVRSFTVAPSAASWLRAHRTEPPGRRSVTVVRGPGLASQGAEVPIVAKLHDDVTVLADTDATAAGVLSALDGAWLGHVAAHGTFRADSPMFSSMRMHDGPLTVYDFEQLQRAPFQLILPSCDSGALAPVGADELLGLVSSLLPLGTAGIVAGVVPLNDSAVVPLMVDLHRGLRSGLGLAEALRDVRVGSDGGAVQSATALSLVALGAG